MTDAGRVILDASETPPDALMLPGDMHPDLILASKILADGFQTGAMILVVRRRPGRAIDAAILEHRGQTARINFQQEGGESDAL